MNRNALLLLAAALLCVLAVGRSLGSASRADPLRELVRVQPERAFAPRLSIDTEYRPCTSLPAPENGTVPQAACGPGRDVPRAADALAAAGESSDPDSLRASALAALLWWDGTDPSLDDAIVRLGKALRLSRDPLPLLVDLSGAHLVRAERTQNPRDLVAGLNYAREALGRDSRHRAALFNAALALELLGIDEQAVRAWDAYLGTDSASAWADEARRRKAAVLKRPAPPPDPRPGAPAEEVEAFAGRDPQRARILGWDHVLGEWGRAVEAGDPARAAPLLGLAEGLGAALERRGGDATLADAVRAIHATAHGSAAYGALAWAHRAYADGQTLYDRGAHAAARDTFARIVEACPPSPVLVEWARVFHGGMMVNTKDYARAFSVFRTLLSQADSVRHPALMARAQWMWGTGLLRQGNYPEARARYQAAARGFARLGEREFFGATMALDGETAYEQGDILASYRSMHRALLVLRDYRGSVWLHNQLWVLARCAVREGMPWAAAPIEDEGFAAAMHSDLPLVRLEALLTRAELRMLVGQASGADRDLEIAAPLVEQIDSGTTREWFENTLRFSRAVAEAKTNPAGSVVRLDSAAGYFSGNVVWLLPALMQRADARLTLGDLAGATADLDTVTARIRGLSRREGDAFVRAAMIDQARNRFDQLVMLHVRAGRTEEALRALERGRVSFAPGAEVRVPAPRGRPAAPPGEVAVEYALIGDTLLTWIVRDSAVHLLRRTVDRDELLLTIERVGAALETPARAASARAGLVRLHDWLMRPVRDHLGASGTPLVILADGDIAGIPFAALLDAERGRYLLEDHPLRFAASLADAHGPAQPPPGPVGPALLVADPAFDRLEYPTLDPLPGARAETNSLRVLYPDAVVLAGRDATLAEFTARAPRASVIHYAGHAVFDDARPERSFLVLAGEGDSGRLSAETVSGMELGGVRLVVLSACRTLRSRQGRSGGFAGLSRAMLAAGAGGVVGSLWKVDDRLAQPLMLAFHREYRRTSDPARALREAQLHLLRSPDRALRSPAAWAGYRYAGR
jgi:CHAT domain-containing protein